MRDDGDGSRPLLLLVEDDADIREQMKWALASEFTVLEAKDRRSAVGMVRQKSPILVLLDLGLPPAVDDATEGLAALEEILQHEPATKVIIVTGNSDRSVALEAVHRGAYDFIEKPIQVDIVKVVAQRATSLARLEQEYRALQNHLVSQGLNELIGRSVPMEKVFDAIRRVAGTTASVLITGESGTGKELVARAIHKLSEQKDGSFVTINCGAIPDQLLESELFGYEKGAFTGAHRQQKGKVEYAIEGTLFLDEIGEMPLALQVKMLRFLQEGVIERVGGRESIRVNTRVLAATNIDLEQATAQGQFRQDLFFRLGVVKVHIPALRERGEDILLLAHAFLKQYRRASKNQLVVLSPHAKQALMAHSWPGNVRELENRLKRAVIMAPSALIEPADLELSWEGVEPPMLSLKEAKAQLEKDMIQRALARCNGNISRAAEQLGVSRQSLHEDLQKHGITVFRS